MSEDDIDRADHRRAEIKNQFDMEGLLNEMGIDEGETNHSQRCPCGTLGVLAATGLCSSCTHGESDERR